MKDYQVGDVVQLRCGGPMLVVVGTLAALGKYRCQWFDEQLCLQTEDFPAEALKLEMSAPPQL